MQTIKLIIPGTYYDSQIYAGRLYLWTEDDSIVVIDWNALVDDISTLNHLKFVAHCAFRNSSFLYGIEWQLFMQDPQMSTLLLERFRELAERPIELSKADLSRFIIQQQDNPFSFPHADALFYYNKLYVGNQTGIQFAARGGDRYPINRKPEKLWDGPVFSIAAKNQILALASGSEGVFEYPLEAEELNRFDMRPRIEHPANLVRWLYVSLFSSSYSGGYLADFDIQNPDLEQNERPPKNKDRVLREIIPSHLLFGHNQNGNGSVRYSWGLHDKLCLATKDSIQVIRYSPTKSSKNRFVFLGIVPTEHHLEGDIISGDSTFFGYVIEGEEGLLIINSQMESMWLDGEPVNWRVFPDSIHYTNHLHVVYDDHLCIHSFNQDYFVDQKTKMVGIQYGR